MKEMNPPMLGDLLIVDDNQQNLALLSKILKEKGHKVRVATDGRMALQVVQARAPELILLDLKMPDMDGYEVLETLKAHRDHVPIPVIVISILSDEAEIVRALKTGCVDYVTKPFRNEEVLTRVDTHLRLNRYQKALETAKEELEQRVHQRTTELEAAHKVLHKSESELRAIYDNAPLLMLLVNRDRRVMKMNEQALSFARRSTDEALGLRGGEALRCVHAYDDPQGCGFGPTCQDCGVRQAVLDTFRTGTSIHYREASIPYQHPDGPVDIHVLISTTRLTEFEEEAVLVCLQDVTERKQAEEALRENEAKIQEAQQMAHLGYWFWNVKTGAVEWSDEVYRIFQLDPQEFTPQIDSILALSPWPEDHERDKELIQRAIDSHEAGSYEQRFLRPDGSTGYYFSTFQGIYDDGGELIAMKGTVQDITERKKTDKALRTNEERLALAQEAASMGMFDWDIIHDQAVCNERYFRIFGLEPQERMLAEEEWLGMVHPDDRGQAQREVRSTLEDRAPYNTEYRIVWADKSTKWVNSKAHVFHDENGNPQRMIGVVTDITERKKAEQALWEQLDELRRWHEVTLNREDRVQELKAEVNALLARLGEPHRYADPDRVDREVGTAESRDS